MSRISRADEWLSVHKTSKLTRSKRVRRDGEEFFVKRIHKKHHRHFTCLRVLTALMYVSLLLNLKTTCNVALNDGCKNSFMS